MFTAVAKPSSRNPPRFFVFNSQAVVLGLLVAGAMNLRIFAITRQGLAALTLAVAALWTCLGTEAATVRQTNRETAASIRTLAHLRRLTQEQILSSPARATMPAFHSERPYTS